MKIVEKFLNKQTGERIRYTEEDRNSLILTEWSERSKDADLRKYPQYLKEFDLDPTTIKDKTIVDVGCGAWGGVLRFFPKDNRKVAVDPLIGGFIKLGIFDHDSEYLIDKARNIRLPTASVDHLFCLNMMDHDSLSDAPRKMMIEFKRIVKPGGKLYVHFHIRPGNKLNIKHLYSFEDDDFNDVFKERHANFNKVLMWRFADKCTVWDRPWKTFWAIFERCNKEYKQ